MRSSILSGKCKFDFVDKPKPKADGNRIIVKVAYAGVCGSDLHYWRYGDDWANGWVLGHEMTGYVEDPGSRKDLKPGDRVVVPPTKACGECEVCKEGNTTLCEAPLTEALGIGNPGGFADYVTVRPHAAYKLADNVDIKEATLIEPAAVGLFAARKIDPKKEKVALVIGGGIIGLMTAMWLKHEGVAQVTLVEPGKDRREFAESCEFIDTVIDGSQKDCLDQILATNGGKMFGVMYECVGIAATLNSYLRMVKSGGKVIVMGVPNEMIPFDFNTMVTRNMQLISSHAWNLKDFEDTLAELTKGTIQLKRFITDIEPLEKVQSVFEDLTSGHTKNIKVLLDVGAED